jgi:tRNA(fMet)-specific endonuclease VapC
MDFVLVDTDVVSFTFKRDTRRSLYRGHLDGKLLFISFMTVAELDPWADARNWGKRKRAELAAFLQPYTVIDSDRELCRTWAQVKNVAQRAGHHLDTADAWIAATALLYEVPLITHNRGHFAHIQGLRVISESPT